MTHELKIWPVYYARVADGTKTFEVRDNDRAFQMGDTVVLREWDPKPINAVSKGAKRKESDSNDENSDNAPRGYTGSPNLTFKIGYIHVLNTREVIFSLIPIPKKAKG